MALKATVHAQVPISNGSTILMDASKPFNNVPSTSLSSTLNNEIISNFNKIANNGIYGGCNNIINNISNNHGNNNTGATSNNNSMNRELPLDIDLEGGTLLSVEEKEEIDPEDSCKVQITCYHILSADQTEERTITRRRKLKVNCTQSLKRVEFSNGKGTKVEERTTIFNNVDALREYANAAAAAVAAGGAPPPVYPTAFHFSHSRDNSGSEIGSAKTASSAAGVEPEEMSDVLMHTQSTFLALLNEKKDQLMHSFPELFSSLRTQPALFQRAPSTVMRTVVNPDGSTTTHTESSKAFSSRYTCQETYLNGVRQETTAKFRAFMEYAGPDGGFCIRLNNADAAEDGEISESEDSDAPLLFVEPTTITRCHAPVDVASTNSAIQKQPLSQQLLHEQNLQQLSGADNERQTPPYQTQKSDQLKGTATPPQQQNEDIQSRISRSGISEIPDTISALVIQADVPKLHSEPLKRRDKAWHAVNELVESEGRYVQKLALLEKFREEVERERLLERRQMSLLFSNIESLYRFHNDHLLPQLMDRRREWHSTQRISDVMRKQAPFLKMYSEYTNNYKRAVQTFDECTRKKKHFEEIVRRIEHMPECENLSLQSHLICPVQRVMRYQLLLKEYQKYLTENDVDYTDTEAALTLVLEAASHANEMMRKLDRYRNVLEVQELLGNAIPLVSSGREFLTKAKLMKISSSTSKAEERLLFVFNDLFLLASERSSLIGTSKFKVRAIFNACYTQICEGDNFEREHSFYLRGADSVSAPLRCVELYCGSQSEKNKLFEVIWSVIDDAQQQQSSNNSKENALETMSHTSASLPPNFPGVSSLRDSGSGAERKNCARCDAEFSWYARGYVCSRCLRRFCKKCFGRLRYEVKQHRLCVQCLRSSVPPSISQINVEALSSPDELRLPENGAAPPPTSSRKRKNLLATPADDSTDVIKAGYVRFRGTSSDTGTVERYFVLRKNFCLYSYKTYKDAYASAMMPMAGCDITPGGAADKLGFLIRHFHRVYHIQCANDSEHAEWLAALILTANAHLPSGSSADDDECVSSTRANNDRYDGDDGGGARTPKVVKRSVSVGERMVNAANGMSNGSYLKPPPHLKTPYGRRSTGGAT